MKGKNLVILVVLAVILVGYAYLSSNRNRQPPAAASVLGKPVLPALQETEVLNSIERLTFRSAAGTVAVAQAESGWVAPAKYGYPVEFNKVHDFVRKLRDLKVGQCMPEGRKQLEELNLLSPRDVSGTNQPTGTLVELADKDGKVLASLVIGKERRRATPDSRFSDSYPDGRFVAADGKPYVVSDTLDGLPHDVKDWLDADLVNVSASDLDEILVQDASGKTLVLRRPEGGGDLKVGDLAEKEEMDTSKVSSLSGTLGYLRFNDVVDPKFTDAQMGFDKAITYTARAKNGKIYTMKIGANPSVGDDRYIRLSVALAPDDEPKKDATAAVTEAGKKEGESDKDDAKKAEAAKTTENKAAEKKEDEEAKKKEEEAKKKREEREKAEKEVRNLNAKLGKWTYIVAKYKVEAVSAERKDFVKAKEEKKEEKKDEKADDGKKDAAVSKGEQTEAGKEEKKGFFQRLFGGGDDKGEDKGEKKAEDAAKVEKPKEEAPKTEPPKTDVVEAKDKAAEAGK